MVPLLLAVVSGCWWYVVSGWWAAVVDARGEVLWINTTTYRECVLQIEQWQRRGFKTTTCHAFIGNPPSIEQDRKEQHEGSANVESTECDRRKSVDPTLSDSASVRNHMRVSSGWGSTML